MSWIWDHWWIVIVMWLVIAWMMYVVMLALDVKSSETHEIPESDKGFCACASLCWPVILAIAVVVSPFIGVGWLASSGADKLALAAGKRWS